MLACSILMSGVSAGAVMVHCLSFRGALDTRATVRAGRGYRFKLSVI
jgi:hypothetical protein